MRYSNKQITYIHKYQSYYTIRTINITKLNNSHNVHVTQSSLPVTLIILKIVKINIVAGKFVQKYFGKK